jgi:hypothetical protein
LLLTHFAAEKSGSARMSRWKRSSEETTLRRRAFQLLKQYVQQFEQDIAIADAPETAQVDNKTLIFGSKPKPISHDHTQAQP